MRITRIHVGSREQVAVEVVGAKAANLACVASLGLPVPPAFVLPIELCAAIVDGDSQARQQLANGLAEGIEFLEETTGRRFGDRRRPLLVSVRSGAARSMPGMLDTVLNVGCTPAAVHGLVRATGNPRFAFDCRRRFLESYGGVVLGVNAVTFKSQLAAMLAAENCATEQALDGEALERLSGLDAIVFTAGIGENSKRLRARVCADAAWLGVVLDPGANEAHGPRLTAPSSRVTAWVVPTNEELMIARHTRRLMASLSPRTASDADASRTLSEKVKGE